MPAHRVLADIGAANTNAASGTDLNLSNLDILPKTVVAAGGVVGTTFTQTYATADATHADLTSGVIVLTATDIAAKTASLTLTDNDETSAATVKSTADQLAKDLGANMNALRVDLVDLKGVVNSLIDALQAAGVVG